MTNRESTRGQTTILSNVTSTKAQDVLYGTPTDDCLQLNSTYHH